jgi:SAM-dependent methyltransferase
MIHVSLDTASPSRVCNYLLGGKDNYLADRTLGDRLTEILPHSRVAARENRLFVGRAVRHLAERGLRQFIDLGTGLPTAGSLHQMAAPHCPDARVVYADIDPIVLVHARALLTLDDRVGVVQADLRNPKEFLARPGVGGQLDLDQPVAVFMTSVLHLIAGSDDPYGAVRQLREALAPGSAIVITHATADAEPRACAEAARVFSEGCSHPLVPRDQTDVARFFDGLELLAPGLVFTTQWRPETIALQPCHALAYAGIGVISSG